MKLSDGNGISLLLNENLTSLCDRFLRIMTCLLLCVICKSCILEDNFILPDITVIRVFTDFECEVINPEKGFRRLTGKYFCNSSRLYRIFTFDTL